MAARASRFLLLAMMLAAVRTAGADPASGPLPRHRTVTIDFAEDDADAPIEQHTAPPPDIKHPSLMTDKYRGVPGDAAGPELADPLAQRVVPTTSRLYWLGFRLAGGMFDDGAAAARAGLAVGLAGRYRLGSAVFVAARTDWSRRGGDAMTGAIDVLGASLGAGTTVGSAGGLELALIGQLRGDLRLADQRNGDPVRRAGLGIAVGAELALPSSPFTAGLRFEQGLTDLLAGARDRALLLELGVDLR